jgi:hypothetical protein
MEYQIAAIPTLYKGIQFRSRLEARWAAFFDRVGFKWQYEPFDLGSWSPDFLIEDGLNGTLVEVKPITELSVEIISKPALACYERGIDYPWFAIVGSGPKIMTFRQKFEEPGLVSGKDIYEETRVQIGWRVPGYSTHATIEKQSIDESWTLAVEWHPRKDKTEMFPFLGRFLDINDQKPWTHHRKLNPDEVTRYFYPEFVQACWADACNTVQWKKPDRSRE